VKPGKTRSIWPARYGSLATDSDSILFGENCDASERIQRSPKIFLVLRQLWCNQRQSEPLIFYRTFGYFVGKAKGPGLWFFWTLVFLTKYPKRKTINSSPGLSAPEYVSDSDHAVWCGAEASETQHTVRGSYL